METSGFCRGREKKKKGKRRQLLAGFGVRKRKPNVSGWSVGWEVWQHPGAGGDPLPTPVGSGGHPGPPRNPASRECGSTQAGAGGAPLAGTGLGSRWGSAGSRSRPPTWWWWWVSRPLTAMAASWAAPSLCLPLLPQTPLFQPLAPAWRPGADSRFTGRKISPNHIIPRSRPWRLHEIFADLWQKHQSLRWDRGLGLQRGTGLGWTPGRGGGAPGAVGSRPPGAVRSRALGAAVAEPQGWQGPEPISPAPGDIGGCSPLQAAGWGAEPSGLHSRTLGPSSPGERTPPPALVLAEGTHTPGQHGPCCGVAWHSRARHCCPARARLGSLPHAGLLPPRGRAPAALGRPSPLSREQPPRQTTAVISRSQRA